MECFSHNRKGNMMKNEGADGYQQVLYKGFNFAMYQRNHNI